MNDALQSGTDAPDAIDPEFFEVTLFRNNPFRVTGLGITAGAREVSRHAQKLRMLGNLGRARSAPSGNPLAIDPPPDADAIARATQRLSDPVRRIVDEWFWFWPLDEARTSDDEALRALERGDLPAAKAAWLRAETLAGDAIATHNLAVLHHLQALDAELLPLGPGRAALGMINAAWTDAMRRWQAVAEHEDPWIRVRNRIRALNDPRLETGMARALRAQLPRIVLAAPSQLALRSLEDGATSEGQRRVQLVRGSGFPSEEIEGALLQALAPVRARLRLALDTAKDVGSADPTATRSTAKALIRTAGPLLRVIDGILPEGHGIRNSAHHDFIRQVDQVLTVYGNRTEDWGGTLVLERELLSYADSADQREFLRTEIRKIEENAKAGPTWCQPGYFEQPAPAIDVLERARALSQSRDWDGAIDQLTSLVHGTGPAHIETQDAGIVYRPLAHCLCQRAIGRANAAMDKVNAEPSLMERVRKNANANDARFNQAVALASELVATRSTGGLTMYCMACLAMITERYAHFRFNDKVDIVICGACSAAMDQERDARRIAVRPELASSAQELRLAHELAPDNELISSNLTTIEKIARDTGAEVEDTLALRVALGIATLEELVAGLKGEKAETRRQAADALASRGRSAQPAFTALVTALVDAVDDVRVAAERALESIAPTWISSPAAASATGILARAIMKGSGGQRAAGAHWLAQIDPGMLETIRREQRARRLRLMLLWPAIAVSAAILLLVLIGYQVGHPTIVGRLAKVGLIDRSTAIAQITKGYLDGRVSDTPAIEALSNIDPGWARSTEVARNIDQFLLRYHAHWPSAVTGTRSGGEIPRAVLGGSPPASLLVFVRPGPVSATPDISGASAAALAGLHLGWVTTEASAAERRRVIHELLRVVAHRDSPAAIAALRLLRDLPRDVPADEVLFAAVSSRKPAVLREGTVTLHALDRAWWVRSDLPSAYVTEALRHASADALRQSEVDWARVPRSAVQAYFRLVTAAHTPRGALGLHTTNLQQAFEPIKREIGVAICKGPLMDRQMVELCALERQARQAVRR